MIRQATSHDRQALYDLSNTSLALDYLSAQDFYFAHCYDPANVIVNEVDGHPVASLQVGYHVMMLHDTRIMVSAFTGLIGDQADAQGRYRRQLIQQALAEQSCKTLVTLVSTDSEQRYQSYGFAAVYHQRHFTVRPSDFSSRSYYGTDKQFSLSELSAVYRRFTSHFNGYILRDDDYWLRLMDELAARRLNLAVYHNGQGVAEGYMIYKLAKKQTEVSELVYLNGKAMVRLLSYGLRLKPQLDIAVAVDEDLTRAFPKAVSRVQPCMAAHVNDYKLFNALYQSQVKDVAAAFAVSPKPLFISERY